VAGMSPVRIHPAPGIVPKPASEMPRIIIAMKESVVPAMCPPALTKAALRAKNAAPEPVFLLLKFAMVPMITATGRMITYQRRATLIIPAESTPVVRGLVAQEIAPRPEEPLLIFTVMKGADASLTTPRPVLTKIALQGKNAVSAPAFSHPKSAMAPMTIVMEKPIIFRLSMTLILLVEQMVVPGPIAREIAPKQMASLLILTVLKVSAALLLLLHPVLMRLAPVAINAVLAPAFLRQKLAIVQTMTVIHQ